MAAIISLLVVISVSLLVVRIGTIALQMTGLSADSAGFQAQSAFSGVGYTTSEAESIVSHPVRRRICRILMLLGTAGITSVVATLILTFTHGTDVGWYWRLGGAVVGVFFLFLIAHLPVTNMAITWAIRKALQKWTTLEVKDYEQILHLAKGYSVAQILVEPDEWVAEKSLRRLNLTAEGVIVLSIIRKDGSILGAPGSETVVHAGDTLMCYGREENLTQLADRKQGPEGDEAHREMTIRHKLSQSAEISLDREAETHTASDADSEQQVY